MRGLFMMAHDAVFGFNRPFDVFSLQLLAQLADRSAQAEREANNTRRLQEENAILRKRLDKLEKITVVTDESLKSENAILMVRGY